MRISISSEKIQRELYSDYNNEDLINRQISAVEQYLDNWIEKTPNINRKMPIAYLKNAIESTCRDRVDVRVILCVLLKRDFKLGKTSGDHCTNMKFSDKALKDQQGMKNSGAFKIYPQKYEKICLDARWRALLDSNAEKRQKASNRK